MKSDKLLIKATTISTNTEVICSFEELLSGIREAFKISDKAYYHDGEAWYNDTDTHLKVYEHHLDYSKEQISALEYIEKLRSLYISLHNKESCTWNIVSKIVDCPHGNNTWSVSIVKQLKYCPYCRKPINLKQLKDGDK